MQKKSQRAKVTTAPNSCEMWDAGVLSKVGSARAGHFDLSRTTPLCRRLSHMCGGSFLVGSILLCWETVRSVTTLTHSLNHLLENVSAAKKPAASSFGVSKAMAEWYDSMLALLQFFLWCVIALHIYVKLSLNPLDFCGCGRIFPALFVPFCQSCLRFIIAIFVIITSSSFWLLLIRDVKCLAPSCVEDQWDSSTDLEIAVLHNNWPVLLY